MVSENNPSFFSRMYRRFKVWLVLALLYCYAVLQRRTVLVVAEKYGRLGNRIYLAAHIMAFAQRGRFIVLLPSLEEYVQYFRGSDRDLFCRYPAVTTPFLNHIRLFRNRYYSLMCNAAQYIQEKSGDGYFKTIRITQDQEINLGEEQFLKMTARRKVLFFCGWMFHDFEALAKYADQIRPYFQPLIKNETAIAAPIEQLRRDVNVVIAIAIRHGDYRDFQGGRYFFQVDDYAKLMRRLSTLFSGRKVGFFIVSDEDQDTSCFKEFIHIFRPHHPMENLFSIARCDYVVSSPSSYAGSAAFLGNIPIIFVKNINDEVAITDFGPSHLVAPQ